MGFPDSNDHVHAEDNDENKEDDENLNEMKFKAKQGGFRWYGPSKSGLLCHIFQEPGVFFFSDL